LNITTKGKYKITNKIREIFRDALNYKKEKAVISLVAVILIVAVSLVLLAGRNPSGAETLISAEIGPDFPSFVDFGHINWNDWSDSAEMFATDTEKREAAIKQLELHIAETLKHLDVVEDAVVSIQQNDDVNPSCTSCLPNPPIASAVITITPDAELTDDVIEGINRLILTAVPDLTSENLYIEIREGETSD